MSLAEATLRAPDILAGAVSTPPAHLRFDADFVRDPYPHYAALREAGPIHWTDALFNGAWVVTRHADVDAVLRDPGLSAQRTAGWVKRVDGGDRRSQAELRAFQHLFSRAMIFLDAPDHTRVRTVLGAGFHPARIRAQAPRVAEIVTTRIAAVAQRPRFDFMAEFARPVPSLVTCMLLGVDAADQQDFIAWSDDLAAFMSAPWPTLDQARAAQRSLLALKRYFDALLTARRKAPGEDLVSLLLAAEAEGLFRSDAELVAQCAMLLLAGHETTRNLLGNGLHALLNHPEQWKALIDDPALVPGSVRELLRYDSPVQYTGRRVIADTLLCGQRVRRGELVIALIGSANRDPDRYTDPDRLDIRRREPTHLSFGRGAHVCIGAGLALMQAEIAFASLIEHLPTLMLAGRAQQNGNAALRGLAALPVMQAQA